MSTRRSSTMGRVALGLITTFHLTGCMRIVERPRVVDPIPDSVVLADFEPPRTLHHPRIEGDELVGWERGANADSSLVRVPATITTKSTNTALAGMAITAIVIVVIGLKEMMEPWGTSSSG